VTVLALPALLLRLRSAHHLLEVDQVAPRSCSWSPAPGLGRVSRLVKELVLLLTGTPGQPVTVKVADATLPLW
jgi:hypothetical protein